MLFINCSSVRALSEHELISEKIALAIAKERKRGKGPFLYWRELSERVDCIDEKLQTLLEDDPKVGLTSGA